ncbi:helix-turn-helix domain-containing protein [Magnetococcales bacterium HHB-1]
MQETSFGSPAERHPDRSSPRMTLGRLRKAQRISQQELAEKLRIKQSSISKMENGSDIHVSTLKKLVRAIGGELRLVAAFPEKEVRICNWE